MGFIYKITNQLNNKCYIGKTLKSIAERWKDHITDYNRPHYEKRPLYDAMNKYGINNFFVEQIEECDDSLISEREVYWIKYYNSYVGFENSNGYNATIGGDGKAFIDRQEVIKVYQECQTIKETAQRLNISTDSVHDILVANNIFVKSSGQIAQSKAYPILMIKDNQIIKRFNSSQDAAVYCIKNGLSKATVVHAQASILRVCYGGRKTAFGYVWQYE